MLFEPTVRSFSVSFKYLVKMVVESGAMIHVAQMGNFMRDNRFTNHWRRHDQPPIESD